MTSGSARPAPRHSLGQIARCVVPGTATLGAVVYIGQSAGPTLALRRAYAAAATWVLRLFGADVAMRGTDIASSQFTISVVTACTGLFVTGLFLVAVAAFPTSWRSRFLGAALGIVGLFALNVVRLTSLFYIGTHWPNVLDVAHQLVWQSIVIVAAVALWLAWAGRAATRRAQA